MRLTEQALIWFYVTSYPQSFSCRKRTTTRSNKWLNIKCCVGFTSSSVSSPPPQCLRDEGAHLWHRQPEEMVRSVKYLGFIRDNKPSSISTPHMSINTADKDFCRPQTLSAFNPFFTLVPSGGRCRQHISFKKRGLGRNFVFSAIRGFEKPEHTVMFLNVSSLLVYVPCSGCRFCAQTVPTHFPLRRTSERIWNVFFQTSVLF